MNDLNILCILQAQLENKGEEQTNSSPVIKIKEAIKKITVTLYPPTISICFFGSNTIISLFV